MEILIISGLSGGGKSRAASFLEDMGFYIVDNMPAAMILRFADFCAGGSHRYDRVALVYDVRTGDSPDELLSVLHALQSSFSACCLLFLEASTETIIHRYQETRRRHPLLRRAASLSQAVEAERELMAPLRRRADFVIDTTHFSAAQLRAELMRLFGSGGEPGGMGVSVSSFGFKYGLPLESDLVFDVRFLPNPFYVPQLRPCTGLDRAVADYVFSFPQAGTYLEHLRTLLAFSLPLYAQEGKPELAVSVGCTGGRHRSVAMAHALAESLRSQGCRLRELHRDIDRPHAAPAASRDT